MTFHVLGVILYQFMEYDDKEVSTKKSIKATIINLYSICFLFSLFSLLIEGGYMKKKHIIFISIIVLIILSGIIAYVYKYNKDSAFNKNKSIALYTIPAKEKIFVNGIIVPEKTENIYIDQTKGSINKVSVTDGQVVKKGNRLFTYKNSQITDQIDLANQQITTSENQKKALSSKKEQANQQAVAQSGVNVASTSPLTASISG